MKITNPVIFTFIVILALYLIGIRFYNLIKITSQSARISSTIETFEDLANGKTALDLGMGHHFAVLSAEIYGDRDSNGFFTRTWDSGSCSYKEVLQQWQQLAIPDNAPKEPSNAGDRKSRLDADLVYGLWYREMGDNDVEVALVFRGTDEGRDHRSNFRWFFKLISDNWDQYDLTRTVTPFVENFVKEKFAGKNIRIIATGHSLGGGLAQQAAYASSTIKTVYAFDCSSVTGYYDVEDEEGRDKVKQGMRIYRIHERGEILAYLRAFMSVIYPVVEKNPQIVRVTYNFNKGGAVGQHSIEKLACAIIDTGKSSDQ